MSKQDENITVSVALCTYNGARFLRQQLDTLLNQSFKQLEIIIVDDASTDNTFSILKEYQKKDGRIQLFTNETTLGFNKNFEKALSLTTGTWVAIADQDDIWHLQKIEHMLNTWNGQSQLMHCSSKKFTAESNINFAEKPSIIGFSGTATAALAFRNTTEGHNILVKRSFLEKMLPFPEATFYDWWLGINASIYSSVQWVPEVFVWRRIHDANAYEKKTQPFMNETLVWKQHLHAFSAIKGIRQTDKELIDTCISHMNGNTDTERWQSFIFKNRDYFFYYKKGLLSFFSKYKHSRKLARKIIEELKNKN